MTPEDVLIEAIAAASFYGDSPGLRVSQCEKLRESIKQCSLPIDPNQPPQMGSDADLNNRRN